MEYLINVIEIIVALILLGSFLYLLYAFLKGKNNNIELIPNDKEPRICILIPARDESAVIGNLLKSIKEQTYKINMEDVYVIVEDIKDKTIDICKENGASYVVRKHLELKRKGYALDEGIKHILNKNKRYDMYFIFDADNILDENYLMNILPFYHKGYQICMGYRNTKNGNANVIAACSTLTFSMVNTFMNRIKIKDKRTIMVSGTGFYIDGSLIDKWQGYPFHELTEDYELTMYATLNNISTYYYEDADFYDEQPTSYDVSLKQRTRWVKGFFSVRKKYMKEIREKSKIKNNNQGSQITERIGLNPLIAAVVAVVIYLVMNIILCISFSLNNISYRDNLYAIFGIIFLIYLALLIFTAIMLSNENKKLNLNYSMKIKALFFNPIFLATYVICIFKALKKDVGWDKIEHTENRIK